MASNYPLVQLKAILSDAPKVRGVVVRASGGTVQVATAKGLIAARSGAGIIVGLTVTVSDGYATPEARATMSYPL